ncbi:MAG TPA: tetratricopeptide repeat protein [Chthoniobacterales bacterium]|nr:tetratricopeptide repeat protein [Chthoniobacterales bacterium]
MASLSFVSGPRTDKSFSIGLGLVILFAVAEIGAVGIHYIGQMRPARVSTAPREIPAALPSAAPSAPPMALTVSSPVAALTPPTTVSSEIDRLTKQAQAARESGDTVNAVARLQDAAQRDPKNAEVLAEMAMIYESTQNFDKSAETWRRVQEIGPSAGPLYDVADTKLRTGVPTSTSSAAAAPAPTAMAKLDVNAPRGTVEGIPAGSTLGISEVAASETPDPDSETNLMLRISVKKRPNAVIDHTKVKIQVFFYDTVGDNDIKLTDADVSYEWLTPNHDWADSNSETLAVTYIRPKSKSNKAESDLAAAAAAINPAKKGKPVKATPPTESGVRKYLGYIVRVYYNDQLQDKRADPTKLLTLFPAPFTAPPQ